MWDQVCIDGVWYHYDATWDDPVDDRQKISHLYLNLSDEILSLDHKWDKDKYHSCDCMDENYVIIRKGIGLSDISPKWINKSIIKGSGKT